MSVASAQTLERVRPVDPFVARTVHQTGYGGLTYGLSPAAVARWPWLRRLSPWRCVEHTSRAGARHGFPARVVLVQSRRFWSS